MKKFFLPFCAFILLVGCSPAKFIATSAKNNVLQDSALRTAHVGISIFEPATGKYWYNYQGDKYFVPASNTKIPTCYAAMKYLGDSLVGLRYSVHDDAIYIQPTGDPTFLHSEFKAQPVYHLLSKYRQVVIQKPEFEDTFLGSGWTWNDYREGYTAQRSNLPMYGNVVKLLWKNPETVQVWPETFKKETVISGKLAEGFDVAKAWERNTFVLTAGTTKNKEVPFRPDAATIQLLLADTLHRSVELAPSNSATASQKIHSQPTDSMLKPLMHRSDNFFAEQSLLMVSNEVLGVMNDAKIIDTLLKTVFKDLPQKPRWADGSGLSRYNLFTPQDFVFILNKMKNEFGMERLKEILPTGNEGTLNNFYKSESGYIFAKTGTLSGVVALSGFLYTKQNKLLIFSVLVNNHQASAVAVRRAVEKFIQGLREKY